MVRVILFLLIIMIFPGCNANEPVQTIQDRTYFNGTVNSQAWEGDGITFFKEDSTLHLRGFLGDWGFHYQIDIVLKNRNPGMYFLDSLVQYAGVSEIVGMDGIGPSFNPQPQDSSFIIIEFDNNYKHVSGDIKFLGFSQGDNRSISLVGTYYIKVGEIGQSNWTCDFNRDGICNCRFLE